MNTPRAAITGLAYHLPSQSLSNDEIAVIYPDWTPERILEKTGIRERHIAATDECASDIGVHAAKKLLATHAIDANSIDFLILCTQSPDYLLPTTACIMQDRLGIPTTAGALDFNLGCSGYIYGLGLAKGLIETSQARRVLLITAETYSKHLHPQDRSVRTLFGDAAAATLIDATNDGDVEYLGPFVYGTDGRGAMNLVVPTGGMRRPRSEATRTPVVDENGCIRTQDNLFMDGPEIFRFTLDAVPNLVRQTLSKAGLNIDRVDHFVFHQANGFMLSHLRKRSRIPKEKFAEFFDFCGNTVSSTIPIALVELGKAGGLRAGSRIMLVGFGVGYSWGACMVRWRERSPERGAMPNPGSNFEDS
jgi:3-oxoacyl-[acyl-carrier-protein] synthase III